MFKLIRQRLSDAKTLKALCFGAEQQANHQGQQQPGAEHFVQAALGLPDGTALQVFQQLGITAEAFDAAIESQYRSALATLGLAVDGMADLCPPRPVPTAQGPYRAQASGQALMAVLTREVMKSAQQRDAAAPLLAAHVLLAASAAQHGVCARSFQALGVSPGQLAAAATAVLASARSAADSAVVP